MTTDSVLPAAMAASNSAAVGAAMAVRNGKTVSIKNNASMLSTRIGIRLPKVLTHARLVPIPLALRFGALTLILRFAGGLFAIEFGFGIGIRFALERAVFAFAALGLLSLHDILE